MCVVDSFSEGFFSFLTKKKSIFAVSKRMKVYHLLNENEDNFKMVHLGFSRLTYKIPNDRIRLFLNPLSGDLYEEIFIYFEHLSFPSNRT